MFVWNVMERQNEYKMSFQEYNVDTVNKEVKKMHTTKGMTTRNKENEKKKNTSGEQKGHKNNDTDNVKKILNESKTHLLHYLHVSNCLSTKWKK